MKKAILFLGISMLIFTSCSKYNNSTTVSENETTTALTTVSETVPSSGLVTVSLETVPVGDVSFNDNEFSDAEKSDGKYKNDFEADLKAVIATNKYTYSIDTINKTSPNSSVTEIVRDNDNICAKLFGRLDGYSMQYEKSRFVKTSDKSFALDFTTKNYVETSTSEYFDFDNISTTYSLLFQESLVYVKTVSSNDYICEVFKSETAENHEFKYYFDKNGKFLKMVSVKDNEEYLSTKITYSGEVDASCFEIPKDFVSSK